jgi:hypothetical protein
MSREIISMRDLASARNEEAVYNFDFSQKSSAPDKPPGQSAADGYTTRLLKYVPAEVVALFITLDALVRSSPELSPAVYLGIFLFCLAGTWLYLWRVARVRKQAQLLISTVAFAVWVFALGGPFAHFDWYAPIYGGLLLPVFTFAAAVYEA